MEIERIREKAAKALRDEYMSHGYCLTSWEDTPYKDYWRSLVDVVLKTDGIRIKADDQSKPETPDRYTDYQIGYERAQQDMLKAGFVKCLKKEEHGS